MDSETKKEETPPTVEETEEKPTEETPKEEEKTEAKKEDVEAEPAKVEEGDKTEEKAEEGDDDAQSPKRFLPEHKKPDAAPTFPEKVSQPPRSAVLTFRQSSLRLIILCDILIS